MEQCFTNAALDNKVATIEGGNIALYYDDASSLIVHTNADCAGSRKIHTDESLRIAISAGANFCEDCDLTCLSAHLTQFVATNTDGDCCSSCSSIAFEGVTEYGACRHYLCKNCQMEYAKSENCRMDGAKTLCPVAGCTKTSKIRSRQSSDNSGILDVMSEVILTCKTCGQNDRDCAVKLCADQYPPSALANFYASYSHQCALAISPADIASWIAKNFDVNDEWAATANECLAAENLSACGKHDFDVLRRLVRQVGCTTVDAETQTVDSCIRTVVSSTDGATASTPGAIQRVRQAYVYWDYDNIFPKRFLSSCSKIYTSLVTILGEKYGAGSIKEAWSYVSTGRIDYGADVDRLRSLGIDVALAGGKKEAADRVLCTAVEKLIGETDPETAKYTTVVILSSDKDFNDIKRRLREKSFNVISVHNAPRNSEHETMLQSSSDHMIRLTDLIGDEVTLSQVRQKLRVNDASSQIVEIEACWLVDNIAKQKLLENPYNSIGIQCRDTRSHQASTCSLIHIKNEALVDGRMVGIDRLAINNALFSLLERPTLRGKTCTILQPHSVACCGYIHMRDQMNVAPCGRVINVEGKDVPLTDIVENAGLTLAWSNPTMIMQWCKAQNEHDITNCTFIHKADVATTSYIPCCENFAEKTITPTASSAGSSASSGDVAVCVAVPQKSAWRSNEQYIQIDEKKVRESDLVKNKALDFAKSNPGVNGRWCLNTNPTHDAITCSFMHIRCDINQIHIDDDSHDPIAVLQEYRKKVHAVEVVGSRGRSIPLDYKVNVGQQKVDVNELMMNEAIKYLLLHPSDSGKYCEHRQPHDPLSCRFVHRKERDSVKIGELEVLVQDLQNNQAVAFLRTRTGIRGKWCPKMCDASHMKDTCPYVHMRSDTFTTADGAVHRLQVCADGSVAVEPANFNNLSIQSRAPSNSSRLSFKKSAVDRSVIEADAPSMPAKPTVRQTIPPPIVAAPFPQPPLVQKAPRVNLNQSANFSGRILYVPGKGVQYQ